MILKKELIFTVLATFCLTSVLFQVIPIRSPTTAGEYDPWIDTNDDGIIDYEDLYNLASMYRTSGTPINKTALLLELEARLDSLNASLLADYYIKAICDDLFAPSVHQHDSRYYTKSESESLFALLSHLHSGDDISGGTPEVDDIQLGSTEGNSHIYFYEDGSPTGEYIYWLDSLDEFVVSDDIQIWGNITIPTTTRYYSIPGCAWQPQSSTYYFVSGPGAGTYTTIAGLTWWYAPVNLPHGAVVTEFRAWVWDNDATEDIDVMLGRQTGVSTYAIAAISSSGASESFVEYVDDSIDPATINNYDYAYYAIGRLRSGDDNHKLGQVRITYTITETLP